MKAILKRPGEEPKLVEIESEDKALTEIIGGEYDTAPALFGGMVMCRIQQEGLPFNCHFLSRYFYGNILVVGRDKGDKPCDLPGHLHNILMMALREAKR